MESVRQISKADDQKTNVFSDSTFFKGASVSSKPAFFQPKLTIGPVDDPYEREADAVADKIVGISDSQSIPKNTFTTINHSLNIQRKCAHCEEEERKEKTTEAPVIADGSHLTVQRKCAHCEEEEKMQRKESNETAGTGEAPAIVHEVTGSGGQPLDRGVRDFFEPRLGYDLSSVRVHTDSQAAESARSVQAHAYTVGSHVVFGANQFDPASTDGKKLLAHELTHTIQQGSAGNAALQPKLMVGDVGTPAEVEAERVANQVTSNQTAGPITHISSTAMVSRQTAEPNFDSPQKRGGQPRTAFVDLPPEGEDKPRVAVTRYLCNCKLTNYTDKHASTQGMPTPGFSLEYCNGRFSARLTGNVDLQSASNPSANVTGEANVMLGKDTAVKLRTQGNIDQSTVSGTGSVSVGKTEGAQGGAAVDVHRDLQNDRTHVDVTPNLTLPGGKSIGVKFSDVQDKKVNPSLVFTVPIGQRAEQKFCRECRCPTSYCCMKDVPPRDYEVSREIDVEEISPLRYYFALDTDKDTLEPTLRDQSKQLPDEVESRVKAGAKISSIVGYASPEDNRDRPVPNEKLSMSRAKKLKDILAKKLGAGVNLPDPQAGGELMGRNANILPGAGLSDAITDAGFKGPEEFSDFLIGEDIPNKQLADQFLKLLQDDRLKDPSARLSLFGIDAASPAAPRLLKAIDSYI
ncbi:MAG: eCIS core domain-containing protein, partial [Mucilaginibacter sp.]